MCGTKLSGTGILSERVSLLFRATLVLLVFHFMCGLRGFSSAALAQSRSAPSWCRGLNHPNLSACGPVNAGRQQTAPYLGANGPTLRRQTPKVNGWKLFTPTTGIGACGNSSSNYTGTCVVFVSSSTGNDSTCTSQPPSVISPSPRQACATINKGIRVKTH